MKAVIRQAYKEEASQIAELFMLAWPVDEILEYNSISYDQLRESITLTTASEKTIYSYENTFVAEVDGEVVGAMCAYDGADYQRLKQPIVDVLGPDCGFAQLKETEAGEFYLDSVGVLPEFQGHGIGSALLRAMTAKAHSEGHADVALIVDESNPAAERLYARLGFERAGMRMFFGHTMWYMCHRLSF